MLRFWTTVGNCSIITSCFPNFYTIYHTIDTKLVFWHCFLPLFISDHKYGDYRIRTLLSLKNEDVWDIILSNEWWYPLNFTKCYDECKGCWTHDLLLSIEQPYQLNHINIVTNLSQFSKVQDESNKPQAWLRRTIQPNHLTISNLVQAWIGNIVNYLLASWDMVDGKLKTFLSWGYISSSSNGATICTYMLHYVKGKKSCAIIKYKSSIIYSYPN